VKSRALDALLAVSALQLYVFKQRGGALLVNYWVNYFINYINQGASVSNLNSQFFISVPNLLVAVAYI